MIVSRRIHWYGCWFAAAFLAWLSSGTLAAHGQPYSPPDREAPGDRMIQEYLAREADKIDTRLLDSVRSSQQWEALQPKYKMEYFYMLGLWPMPEKTPLAATI